MSCKVQECLWHSTPGGRTNHWMISGRLPFLMHQSDEAAMMHIGFCERVTCLCFKLNESFFLSGLDNSSVRGQKRH